MNSEALSTEDVQQKVVELSANNVDKFDPARFLYIKKLIDKVSDIKPTIARLNAEKAQKAITEYQVAFNQAKNAAHELAEKLINDFPDLKSQLDKMLHENDFHSITRLKGELNRAQRKEKLKRLTSVFQQEVEEQQPQQQLSFDEFLLHQENIATQSEYVDLKAHKLFKDSWVKMHADNLVTQAIKEAPENAGPLNSHMLAIRSLKAMRELSPEYMNRFVSYMDSLLWLEKACEQSPSKTAKNKSKSTKR